jgi:hypothetical protein
VRLGRGTNSSEAIKEASINMVNFTNNPWLGEAFLSEDDPLPPGAAELYLVLYDPKAGDDQAALAVPASLLSKLWAELAPALTKVEGRLRAFGL